jgi:hypothetical protein
MKWDDEGIAVCEYFSGAKKLLMAKRRFMSSGNFYRAAIPLDITDGQSPDPSTWGEPAAQLAPSGCDPLKFFANHSIIFGQSKVATYLGLLIN